MEVLHAERYLYLSDKGTTQQMNILKLPLFLSTVPFAILSIWELVRQIPEHYHYGFTSRNTPTPNYCITSLSNKFGRSLTVTHPQEFVAHMKLQYLSFHEISWQCMTSFAMSCCSKSVQVALTLREEKPKRVF